MNILLSLPLVLALLGSDPAFAKKRISTNTDKGIYGEDNRKLMRELDANYDAFAIKASRSVLAQIPNWLITKNTKESISIRVKDLKTSLNFCDGERFLEQPMTSTCTAFLVGPDLILTAGHCVKDKVECKKNTWVLDYDNEMDFTGPIGLISFPKDTTYSCAELISTSSNSKLDYALVRLDRKIEGREPLKVRRDGKTDTKEPLIVIGHPLGLPKIMAGHVMIRDNTPTYYFRTNADTFSGNSGSPVLGLTSGMVEGILVRGDQDFTSDIDLNCSRPRVCRDNECKGESVQRSTYLPFKNIPKI